MRTIQSNPQRISSTISGILNVCSGSTELKASSGATYLWSTGEISQNIIVTAIGVYSVTVTDSFGCSSTALTKPVLNISFLIFDSLLVAFPVLIRVDELMIAA